MQILCALSLLICAVSSLFFLLQVLGGLVGVFVPRFHGVSVNWGIALVIALLSGGFFAWSAGEVLMDGHSPTTENKQSTN